MYLCVWGGVHAHIQYICLCVKTCSKFPDFTSIPRQKTAYGTLVCPSPSGGVVTGGLVVGRMVEHTTLAANNRSTLNSIPLTV